MEGVAIITYSTYVKEVGIVKYENEEIIHAAGIRFFD